MACECPGRRQVGISASRVSWGDRRGYIRCLREMEGQDSNPGFQTATERGSIPFSKTNKQTWRMSGSNVGGFVLFICSQVIWIPRFDAIDPITALACPAWEGTSSDPSPQTKGWVLFCPHSLQVLIPPHRACQDAGHVSGRPFTDWPHLATLHCASEMT